MQLEDETVQAGGDAHEDWRTFDVGRAMRLLHSPSNEIRRQALRRLHVWWYHGTTQQMSQFLRAAGAPARAISDVASMVQSCTIRRDWHRASTQNIASFRLSSAFNEEVQFDLLLYQSLLQPDRGMLTISHLVCACIRWDATCVCLSKEREALLTAISVSWIAHFGQMETLVLDKETGIRGRGVAD